MIDQMKWHLKLKPAASMFKFRLPWGEGKTDYLDGIISLPVWGRQTTTETRLIVVGDKVKSYCNTTYEEQMFYFNTTTRVQYYIHQNDDIGYDHCYDCAAELLIIENYIKKKK